MLLQLKYVYRTNCHWEVSSQTSTAWLPLAKALQTVLKPTEHDTLDLEGRMYSQNDYVKRRAGWFTEEERIDDGSSRKGTPYVHPQQPFFDTAMMTAWVCYPDLSLVSYL